MMAPTFRIRGKSLRFKKNGEELMMHFLESYLSQPDYPIKIQGTQEAMPGHPGLLLFDGPVCLIGNLHAPTTLAIEADFLLRPRSEVLEILHSKIDASRTVFERSA